MYLIKFNLFLDEPVVDYANMTNSVIVLQLATQFDWFIWDIINYIYNTNYSW